MSFEVFDIAASGMHAQRIKMDTISSNIANINTTRNSKGEKEVYHRKDVNFKEMAVEKGYSFPSSSASVLFDAPSEPRLIEGSMNSNGNTISGVMVDSVTDTANPTRIIYDPSHPDADKDGYVELPNVNIVEEMVNMVNASRAYEANITIAQTTKSMISSAIQI
jgi:flagellar basal-body rod protein FlgC